MKYNSANEPLKCFLTMSTCYKGTRPMTVKGILWHSTGANNPKLSRYVQPSDDAPDRAKMLTILGTNPYNNDMNHIVRNMGMNAWIGKLANGEVATVQTMPWNWKPWGCGSGSKGSCNEGWIQFEICEDQLTDPVYANAVYKEALELTAYLCNMFSINPYGTVDVNGVKVPTILCHADSYKLGLGSNHGDIYNWFPKIINKDMSNVREDVVKILNASAPAQPEPIVTYVTLSRGSKGDAVIRLQKALVARGYNLGTFGPNKDGVDGDFGAATQQAVTKFQQANGLTATGIADNQTLTLLYKVEDKKYSVTIKHLSLSAADKLVQTYGANASKTEE